MNTETRTSAAHTAIGFHKEVANAELPTFLESSFLKLDRLRVGDVSAVRSYYFDDTEDGFDVLAAFVVSEEDAAAMQKEHPELEIQHFPESEEVVFHHVGPYEELDEVWDNFEEHLRAQGISTAGHAYDDYLTLPDAEDIKTDVVWVLKK